MVTETEIKNFADTYYAAMVSGVPSDVFEEAYRKVGLDANSLDGSIKGDALLKSFGYNPASSTTFYDNAQLQSVPEDEVLSDFYNIKKSAIDEFGYISPTTENLQRYSGKINPETGEPYRFLYDDLQANKALITDISNRTNKRTIANTLPSETLSSITSAKKAETYEPEKNRFSSFLNTEKPEVVENILQVSALENKLEALLPPAQTGTGTTQTGSGTTQTNRPVGSGYTVATAPSVVTQRPQASVYQTPTQTAFPNASATGTISSPLQTAGLSAIPQFVSYKTSYTGTPGNVPSALMAPTGQSVTQYEQMREEGTTGVRVVNYVNQFGSVIPVTEINGVPMTAVPAGYVRQDQTTTGTASPVGAAKGGYMTKGYAEGGSVISPQQSATILNKMFGYNGPADERSVQQFLAANPAAAARMGKYQEAMTKMAAGRQMNTGGMVRGYQQGGYQAPIFQEYIPENGKPEDAQNWRVNIDPFYYAQQFGVRPTREQMEGDLAIARYSSFEDAQRAAQSAYQQSQQQPFEDVFAKQQALQLSQQNLLGQAAQPMQQAMVTPLIAQEGQFIPSDAGQTVPLAPYAEAATVGTVEQAQMPTPTTTAQMAPALSLSGAEDIVGQTKAATGEVSQEIAAAQQNESAVSQLQAAAGTAYMMQNPVQREIQNGELISGSTVDATKVAELNAMTQAATATPSDKATVAGQLEGLMQQFEGGATPAWAAGAMRNAQATLAARGVGASSMAGQAIIQAAMESALPIAQADAATRAQFESQNLSNRQQAAMLAAQQRAQFLQIEFDQEFQSRVQNASRIADVANMNFTAEQQVALENARAANTVNLQNLSNRQAMVMAEAAALANLDMANLNNRQQAAVQNAQNFLQMDMANLSNRQQTEIFKSQQMMQALFTDQAAENAAAQFNASSQNQVNQFFAQLQSQTAQFNAAQTNALNQFNAGEVNALREFNSTIQQQRDLFNAQNGLVIAQANAQWRQNIDTLNTAAQNEANMEFARTLNALSAGTLDQLWQRERDLMSFAFTASESAQDRSLNILLADKELDAYREKMQNDEDTAKWTVIADAALDLFS